MSKVQEAVECFSQGFNCSQAIASTYCEQLGLDKEIALKLSCGFGAGGGRLCDTCGAVSGAYILIGLKYGKIVQGDNEAKEKTYTLVREFAERFSQRNGSIICRELLGTDLLTGDKEYIARQINTVCPNMVRDAAEIIEEMMNLR